jgi:hypothetical protein
MFCKFLMISIISLNVFADIEERLIARIGAKELIASSNCYLENLNLHENEPPCRESANVTKKTKITKNLNKYNFCHMMLIDYERFVKPVYCKVTYCTSCLFREI